MVVCAICAASIGLVSASSDETSAIGVSLPLSEVAEIRQYPIAPLKGTSEKITNKERDLKQTLKGAKKKAKNKAKKAAATKKGTKKKARNASVGKQKTKAKTRQDTASGGNGANGGTHAADEDQTKNKDDKNTRSNNMVVSNASGLGGSSDPVSDSAEKFLEKFYNSWDSRGGRKNKNNRGGGRNNNVRRGNKGRGRRRKRQRPGQGWSGGKPVEDHDNWQSGGSIWDSCPCTYVDAPSWWGGSSSWNSGGRSLAGSGSKAGKAEYGRGDVGGGGKGSGIGDSGHDWNDGGGKGWDNGGGYDWNDGGGKGWGGGGGKGMIKVCTCMPTYFP